MLKPATTPERFGTLQSKRRHLHRAVSCEGHRHQWLNRFERVAPRICHILRASSTVGSARDGLFSYLHQRERELYAEQGDLHPLDHATALQCIAVFKSILSMRNETRAGFSTLRALRQIFHDELPGRHEVDEGFLEEFLHLFKGIHGHADVSRGWLGSRVQAATGATAIPGTSGGRAAGIARSDMLDGVGRQMWKMVDKHPSGLEPELIARRARNKARILEFFKAAPEDWDDYVWQLGHIFKGQEALPALEQLIPMTAPEREAIRLCVESGIPFGITPYYLSLFDFESPDRRRDAVPRAQVIPPGHFVQRMIEHQDDREHYFDFMGEHDTSPIDLVTRRYPAIAILKGYDTCPQICVYCQRNWEITGPMEGSALPPRQKLDAALDWFAEHKQVREVLITGGDPLSLSDRRIEYTMDRLAKMEHIIQIRWGTRTPVTLPMRITGALADLLGRYVEPGRRNVGVVTHIESAAEVTPEMAEAVHRLRRQGLYVYNQQVLTTYTSRRFQTAANRVAMKKIGVDPYYTFYPKGKEETSSYTIPLARILQERKEEARLLPGSFRTDEPVFNVPRLGKNHVRASQDRELIAIRPDGRRIYVWHPWEKGVMPTKPWLYVDKSIHGYLQDLERVGENTEDYSTIWYYY